MRWRAALWLAAMAVLVVAALLRCGGQIPVQTDLLTLLPPTERNPVAELAVKRLSEAAGNRAIFLIGYADAREAGKAARRFAARLRSSAAFVRVQDEIPALDLQRLTEPYAAQRFNFLSPADRASLSNGSMSLEERLQRKLYSPFRVSALTDLAHDPFGFFDAYFSSLPFRNMKLEWQDGLLYAHSPSDMSSYVFVMAEPKGSAYDGQVQDNVIAAVDAAEQDLHAAMPQATVLRTGAVFFAADARQAAQHDVDLIGYGSLIGIVLLLLAVFRSVRPLLLALLSVMIGLLAASSCVLLVFGEMHLLTLVFGASLIGEAVDYAIQYFAAYMAAGADWEPWRGLRTVRPSLLLAVATSVLGYASLMLLPFPALRQIALFALCGLIAALLSVFLLLPLLLQQPFRGSNEALARALEKFITTWQRFVTPPRAMLLALVVMLLSLPGWYALQSEDDVRLLITRPPALAAQEVQIRALTGFDNSSQFFLVEADTPEQLLQREESLRAVLDPLVAQGTMSHYQALSEFVPSLKQQAENRALLEKVGAADPKRLAPLLARYGFQDDVARQLSADFARGGALQLNDWLASPMSLPLRHLWLGKTGHGYASVVMPFGARSLVALQTATQGLTGVSLVDKPGNVSRLFAEYRYWGSLGLICIALVVLGLLIRRYGWRGGLLSLLPTLLGMGVALAACAYAGETLTLFNVMGLMLVLGVGVNYAIFLQTGCGRDGITLLAVLLSATTTLLSFGLLAFSGTPALARFGLTLLTGIAAAVLLSPLVLSFSAHREETSCPS